LKVLITGANGMLGTDLTAVLEPTHEVYPTDISNMDIRSSGAVKEVLRSTQPEVVLHLAALTDVDYCETHPEQAVETHVVGTQNITQWCEHFGIQILMLSSIAVFGGDKDSPYTEADVPSPKNVYAKTKYQSEEIVMQSSTANCVVRTGWLFGGHGKDKKFVGLILNLARHHSSLPVIHDTFGSPTYTVDLSHAIQYLMERRASGIYHIVNRGKYCTRLTLAQQVVKYAGINTCNLVPVKSSYFSTTAPRPRMEAATSVKFKNAMRHWKNALKEYIELRERSE
jgi:dTDP-4-dehydrorhamnose reductase